MRRGISARTAATWAGFALAPILYIIALAGIAGTVLFTGYTQILRSNVEITADNAVRNQLRMASEVVSSRSLMNSVALTLDPPEVVSWSSLEAARIPKDAGGTTAITEAAVQGSADSIGALPTDGGVRQLDPWGRYFVMCRWVSSQNNRSDPSIAIITAGPDGNLATTCADTQPVAGSDDKMEFMSVANVMTRSATWQAQGDGTYSFGIDPSSARVAVGVDSEDVDETKSLDIGGDGRIRGDLLVNGAAVVEGATALQGVTAAGVTSTSLSTGTLAASGAATLASSLDVTGATTLASTLAVTGASTLAALSAGATTTTTLAASGAATLGSTLAVTGATTIGGTLGVTGNTTLAGTLAAGATSVSTLATSGAATLNSAAITTNLAIGGNATATGTITAANFVGNLTGNVTGNVSGSAGSVDGSGISGVVPIDHGGTNATTAAGARTSLGLAIGSDVEAWDTDLDALAAISSTGFVKRSGAGAFNAAAILQAEVPAFSGASSGAAGTLGGVPQPAAGQQNFLLRGDGTWIDIGGLTVGGIGEGDSGIDVNDTGTGAIIFTVDGYEQARITAGANADRSVRITGGSSAGSTHPEVAAYSSTGNSNLRLSALGTGSLLLRAGGSDRLSIADGGSIVAGGSITAGGFVGNLTGNASTATTLASARNFSITGDATASAVSFNGSADVALASTVTKIRGVTVAAAAPTANQVLQYNSGTTSWTPTSLTLSGDNIDGGTIGETSGTALVLPNGAVGTPALRFLNDTDMGLYRIGTDILGVATAGAERVRVDASGNVGIGVTSTSNARLTIGSVSNAGKKTYTNADFSLGIDAYYDTTDSFLGVVDLVASRASDASNGGSIFRFFTQPRSTAAPAERVRIDQSGNVGIGTSSPGAQLDLAKDGASGVIRATSYASNSTLSFRQAQGTLASPTASQSGNMLGAIVWSGYGATGFAGNRRAGLLGYAAENWTDTAQGTNLTFETTPTGSAAVAERMRIDSSGNVGIGASSPTNFGGTNVHIASPSAATYGSVLIGSGAYLMEFLTNENNGVMAMGSRSNHALSLVTNDTARVTITNAGNVGIGTTTPGAYKLNVNGDTNITGNLVVSGTVTGAGGGGSSNLIGQGDSNVTVTDAGTGSITVAVDGSTRATFAAGNLTTAVPVLSSAGSASAPSLSFSGDPNTGLYSSAADQLSFATGGVQRLIIDAGGAIHAGQGWTSTNTDIDGLIPGTAFGSLIQGAANGHVVVGIRGNDGNDSFSIVSGGNNFDADGIYDTLVLSANAVGDVGIGTTASGAKLDIDTGSNTSGLRIRGLAETAEIADIFLSSAGAMILSTVSGTGSAGYIDLRPEDDQSGLILRESDGTGTSVYANFYVTDTTDDYLGIGVNQAAGATTMNVTAVGNVGFGTTAPAAALEIKSASGSRIRLTDNTTPTAYTTLHGYDGGGAGADGYLDIDTFGDATSTMAVRLFRSTNTSGNVSLRIGKGDGTTSANTVLSGNADSYINALAGNVGIGTTSPGSTLHIVGSTLPQLRLSNTETNSTAKYGVITTTHYTTAEEPMAMIGAESNSGTNILYIGGGFSTGNAATSISLRTAANNTTTVGTERMSIASNGTVTVPGNLTVSGTLTAASSAIGSISAGDSSVTVTDSGTGSVATTVDGVSRMTVAAGNVTTTVPVLTSAGSASAPSLSFSGDPNTGIYSRAADDMAFSTGGSLRLIVNNIGVMPQVEIYGVDGTAGTPSYNFGADAATGMYRPASGTLGFSTNGVSRMTIDSTGATTLTGDAGISTGTLSFGATTRQMINLWSTSYGIGIQSNTQYYRSANNFAWFKGGTHSSTAYDSGGGTNLMSLAGTGDLTVYGTVSTSGSNKGFLASIGDAATPTFSFVSDPNTGMYRAAVADTLGFATAGTTAMTLDATGNAVVTGAVTAGSGVTAGSWMYSIAEGSAGFYARRTTTNSTGVIVRGVKRRGTEAAPLVVASGDILLDLDGYGYDGAADARGALIRMRVDGTPGAGDMPGAIAFYTTPDGSTSVSQRMEIGSDGLVAITGNSTVGGTLGVTGVTTLTGNVAIATTAPLSKLAVGAAGAASTQVWIQGQGTTSATYSLIMRDSAGTNLLYVRDDGVVIASKSYIRSDADMRAPRFYDLDDTGYYTDPASTSIVNAVDAVSLTGDDVYATNWFRVAGTGGVYWTAYSRGLRMTGADNYIRAYNGSEKFLMSGYFHSSDARLKHDVRDDTRDPFTTVKGLRAVHFKWNENNKQDYGVIAQEVLKVLPEAVETDPTTKFMTVQYDKLVLPVIEAVKKLIGIVEELQAKVAALLDWKAKSDARIEALQAENAELKQQLHHQDVEFDRRLDALESHSPAAANDNDKPIKLKRAAGAGNR